MRKFTRLIAVGLVLVSALTPATAFGAGTGDDPRPTKDKPTKDTLAVQEDYKDWVARGEAPAIDTTLNRVISEAVYRYYYTPTHAQERSYWCGPATVQTIDDYWGATTTQSAIAGILGTTSAGTNFQLVDDALRSLTGISYVVSPVCASTGDVYSQVQYGLLTRGHPAAADVRIIGSVWPNYIYSHAGHIIPIEAFDWRNMTIRINDPYSEALYRTGGGQTLGHRTYPAWQVADGVVRHWQKVLVY